MTTWFEFKIWGNVKEVPSKTLISNTMQVLPNIACLVIQFNQSINQSINHVLFQTEIVHSK